MKTLATIGMTSLVAFLLIGCSGSPTPSKPDAKPTIFVKSHTAEKFKDLTEATAIWNGISPYYVKDKQYMRCDMTEEAMVTLVHYGFDIVTDEKDADYSFETTLLVCGGGRNAYIANKSEIPLQEKAIYKDFMKWVDETEPSELPKTAKEIAVLIKDNNPEGFERFHKEEYTRFYGKKFNDTENWSRHIGNDRNYFINANKLLLPNKYAQMPDEDKQILEELGKKFSVNSQNINNSIYTGGHMASTGFNMLSSHGFNSGGSSAIGGAGAVIGLVMMFGGVIEPYVLNSFLVTNNRTGKTWSADMRFTIPSQTWKANITKPMDDWLIDEIPWSDLD